MWWPVDAPASDLAAALASITKADCDAFGASWTGVKPWPDEVAGLVHAVERVLSG